MIHGASSVTVSRLVPHIVKLLSDPTALVRDCAFSTLVECYKHYGERLRIDLSKKHNVPPSNKALHLANLILAKFTFGGRVAMDHQVHVWRFKLSGPLAAAW
ncbi:CLIP-associating protein 1-B [Portunus trituberculatus]|uniref:CLIP-associating protein 1-B n=1 Tax=Portunus trituberculatus TaxID=210409 RepID=A0A5B7E2X6_PORTR|nr:CLIP-associating protein 1-B [Portunus trituberculatus]